MAVDLFSSSALIFALRRVISSEMGYWGSVVFLIGLFCTFFALSANLSVESV